MTATVGQAEHWQGILSLTLPLHNSNPLQKAYCSMGYYITAGNMTSIIHLHAFKALFPLLPVLLCQTILSFSRYDYRSCSPLAQGCLRCVLMWVKVNKRINFYSFRKHAIGMWHKDVIVTNGSKEKIYHHITMASRTLYLFKPLLWWPLWPITSLLGP